MVANLGEERTCSFYLAPQGQGKQQIAAVGVAPAVVEQRIRIEHLLKKVRSALEQPEQTK